MGHLDFSPELITAWNTKRLWQLVYERTQGKFRSRTTIRRLARKLKITAPMNTTLEEAKAKHDKACQEYGELKPHAGVLRYEYLQARQIDPTCTEDERKRAAQALLRERAKTASRQLKRLKGTVNGAAIKEIEVHPPPGHEGPPQRISEPGKVEQGIMNMIQTRYHLLDSTPLMEGALLGELGLKADTPTAQAILEGETLQLPTDNPAVQDFLHLFKRQGDSGEIPLQVSTDDFLSYWKRAKEDTSSSLSGRHFGHYKTATRSPLLTKVYTQMCNLTYAKGCTLNRWKKGLTVMLEKEPGNIDVERLRAILLLEADFNFLNKLYFGSRMIDRAHQDSLIPPESFGGVKHRNPHHLALTRKCMIDLSTLLVLTLAVASVDAAQCYDRIQHTTASMACQSWGVPLQALLTLLTTIQQMQIHLRTAHGDTDTAIPNNPSDPFQGVLQGNGAGPAIWLAISAFLVTYIHHTTPGTTICTPMTQKAHTIAGVLFVDDTDILSLAQPGEKDTDVVHRLQQSVNAWQTGLQITGGALKKKKCAWTMKAFRFRNGQPKLAPISHTPGEITIAENNDRAAIKRNKPTEAVKAVGFVQSLDGTMKAQLTTLQKQANGWAAQLKKGHLDRKLAWHAIRTTIWPSLRFPLSACTFSWDQGDQMMRKLYQSLLPALGANRRFPKLWRHAPMDFMGLDLPHPHVEQGIEHICTLLTLGSSASLPGTSLRAALEAAQMIVGCNEEFLHADTETWAHLLPKHTLPHSMWTFQWEHGIQVNLDPPLLPPPQRENDQPLMEIFLTLPDLSPAQFAQLNQCRLAKQVYFLSDLADGQGHYILPSGLLPPSAQCLPLTKPMDMATGQTNPQ